MPQPSMYETAAAYAKASVAAQLAADALEKASAAHAAAQEALTRARGPLNACVSEKSQRCVMPVPSGEIVTVAWCSVPAGGSRVDAFVDTPPPK